MMNVINYRDVKRNHYYITDDAKVFEKISRRKDGLVDISNTIHRHPTNGYWQITLLTKGDKHKTYPLYRLVIASFQGDKKDMVVDHLDMNKDNNHLSNLEYVTLRENFRRAAVMQERAYTGTLSEQDIRKICELLEKNYHATKIVEELNLPKNSASLCTVVSIANRTRWTSISKDYNWDIDDVRLKVYTKEDLRLMAYMLYYSGYGPKEIAEHFPKYDLKKLNHVVKKMSQGKLYKKFLEEAGSTTIAEGIEPPRDSDGFMRLMPTALGVKRLRKIRQDLENKS